jgi:diacylglycerol kinase family enzyme
VAAIPSASGTVVAVVHPLKAGPDAAARLARWASAAGRPEPVVVETTEDSPGTEQARAAVADGADLVLAWGGDGTVSAVATGLLDSGVPLGLIPGGTGNLLARNLGLPLDEALAAGVAFSGADRRIDAVEVGLGGRVMTSTVITGIGLDALLIDAPEVLKGAIGPSAYVLNSVRALGHRRMRIGVAIDDGPPQWFAARSVLVVNVGGLIAGLDVAPEADADDGFLDVVVLRLGRPSDWVRTAARMAQRRPRSDDARVVLRGRSAWIVSSTVAPRQVDGDVVGDGRALQARVRPLALTVRVPA